MADGKPIIVPIRAGLKDYNKDLNTASTKLKGWGDSAKTILKGVGVGLGVAAAGVGKSVTEFAALDDSVREVGTLLGETTTEQLDGLQTAVRGLAKELGEDATGVATAFYDSISAGVASSTEEVEAFVLQAGKFATAGATEVGTGVDLLTSSINAFGLSADDAERVSDIFFSTVKAGKTTVEEIGASFSDIGPAAAVAGVSMEEVSSWLAQLTLSGTPTSKAATQIKGALAELSKDGTKLSNTFKEITDKSFMEFMDEGGSLEEAFALIGEHAQETGQSVFDLAGSVEAAQGILGATENLENFGGILDSVSNSAGATQTAFEIMDESSGTQLEKVKAAITDVQYTIGAAFLPVLNQIIPVVEPVLSVLGDLALTLVSALAPVLTDLINQLLPPFMDLFAQIQPYIADWGESLGELIPPLVEIAVNALPGLMALLEPLLMAVSPIIDVLSSLADWFADLTDKGIPGMIIAVGLLLVAFAPLSAPLLGIVAAIAGISAGIVYLIQNFDKIKEAITGWASKIANWLWDAFKDNWVVLLGPGGLVYWLFTKFDIASKLADFGRRMIGWIWDAFIMWARFYYITIPTKLWEWIKAGSETLVSLGKDIGQWIVDGIIEFIKSAAGEIADAVTGAASGLGDKLPVVGDVIGGAKSVVGKVGGFFGFAEGGLVTGPTLGLIGEAGPELVLPLDKLPMMGGGGTTIVNNIYIDGGLDSSEAIGERVEEALQAWSAHKGPIDVEVA